MRSQTDNPGRIVKEEGKEREGEILVEEGSRAEEVEKKIKSSRVKA